MEARKQVENRISWIDNCKGLAIIMIVYEHCFTERYAERFFHSSISMWFSYFHVSIFFVIAGYLFAMKTKADYFWGFIVKKMKRLLVPFWLFSLLYWIEIALFKLISGREWFSYLKSNMINLINGLGGGVQWFLSILFIAEIILFFVDRVRNKKVMLAIILIMLTTGLYVTPLYEVFRKSLIAVGFMAVGYYYEKCESNSIKRKIAALGIGATLHFVGIVFNGSVGMAGLNFGKSEILYFVLSSGACVGLMSLFSLIKKPILVLSYFGKESMIVLCTHIHIIEVLWQINNNWLKLSWFDGAVLTTAVLLLEIPVIYMFKKWMPKTVGVWK